MMWKRSVLWLCVLGCSEYNLEPDRPDVTDVNPSDHPDLFLEDVVTPPIPERVGTGGVAGVICSPDASGPILGAIVWVDVGTEHFETTTDVDGLFRLEGIPEGVHEVTAEKGSFQTVFEVQIDADVVVDLAEEECLGGDVEIAVISGMFDSIEHVLDDMTLPYTMYPSMGEADTVSLLRDPAALSTYDILMINCDMNFEWMSHGNEISDNLESFVDQGGSLYVSDWSFYVVEGAFPDMIDFVGNDRDGFETAIGSNGTYSAQVLDAGFSAALGRSETEIEFDQSGWVVPETVGTGQTLIESEVTIESWTEGLKTLTSPVLVRLEHGEGDVFYTSFHNEVQVSGDVSILLKQIVENL